MSACWWCLQLLLISCIRPAQSSRGEMVGSGVYIFPFLVISFKYPQVIKFLIFNFDWFSWCFEMMSWRVIFILVLGTSISELGVLPILWSLPTSVRLSWAVNNLNERRCQWQSQWRTMPIADNINCLWEKTSMEETLNWRCSQKTTSIQKANIASIQLTILQNHQSQEPNSTETELGKSPSSLSSYHLFYQLDKFQKRLK